MVTHMLLNAFACSRLTPLLKRPAPIRRRRLVSTMRKIVKVVRDAKA